MLKDHFNLIPDLLTGPATDNQVGIDIIEKQSNIKAINALTNSAKLGNYIESKLSLQKNKLGAQNE